MRGEHEWETSGTPAGMGHECSNSISLRPPAMEAAKERARREARSPGASAPAAPSLGHREEAPSLIASLSLQTGPGKGRPLSTAAHQGGWGLRGWEGTTVALTLCF